MQLNVYRKKRVMFWTKKTDTRVQELEIKLQEAERKLAEYKVAFGQHSNAMFVLDFDVLQPFSIERMIHTNGMPVTCFGYFKNTEDGKSNAPLEWIYFCDIDTHNKLADQFKTWLESKKK